MNQTPTPDIVNFIMVGCPRCGTTWVNAALKDHPQVFLPPQKQTYFFDVSYDKGIDWYLANFTGATPKHLAVGEIATGYSQDHAVPRLAEHFPHVKILLAMRNPSERAYSFYQSRAVGEGWQNIREAVAAQPAILEQGKYIDQIEHLLKYYDREKLQLLFYDDLHQDDKAYLRSILEFLQVDTNYESPQLGRMVQVAAFPRVRRIMRRLKLGWLVDFVSKSPIGDMLRKQIKSRGVKRYAGMDADTRAFLDNFYRPYNQRLQSFSGRDLSGWTANSQAGS
jgi:hypothetical protein